MNETYELHLGDDVQVRIMKSELQVRQGAALKPDVIFHTDMQTFVELIIGQIKPDEAIPGRLYPVEVVLGLQMGF